MLPTRRTRRGPACGAGLLGCVGLGCAGATPTLEPALFPAPPPGDCVALVSRVEHVDEPTALGFSAIEALGRLAGRHSSPLFWIEPAASEEYVLSYGPEHGRSTLALDVRLRQGPLLLREHVPRLGAPDDTVCEATALEIPVTVAVESGGLALAESFEAVLAASAAYRAELSAQLDPRALRGGLGLASVTSLDPQRSFQIGLVSITAELWPGGSRGALAVQVNAAPARGDRELVPVTPAQPPGSLALWPSSARCEGDAVALPAEAPVLGFSAAAVLQELTQAGPRQLTWADGTVSQVLLEFDAEPDDLCQELSDSLRFAAMLRARSEEPALDLRLPVSVEAHDAGGRIGEINVSSLEEPEGELASAAVRAGATGASEVALGWTHAGEQDTGWIAMPDARRAGPGGSVSRAAGLSGRW